MMKIFLSMSLCLWIFLCAGSPVHADQDGDWQFWNSTSLEGNVHPRWKLRFEEQFRFGDQFSEFNYHYTDIGLTWKTSTWFQAALAYAQVYELKKGEWKEEHRPFIDGTLQGKWKGFQFSDRNRVERRFRQEAEDIWRYRSSLTVSPVRKWSPIQIQPYTSGEVFVDLDERDYNQYRLAGGFTGRLAGLLQAKLYYLRQGKEKEGDWTVSHILGATVKVNL
jgi:hypothetical protein